MSFFVSSQLPSLLFSPRSKVCCCHCISYLYFYLSKTTLSIYSGLGTGTSEVAGLLLLLFFFVNVGPGSYFGILIPHLYSPHTYPRRFRRLLSAFLLPTTSHLPSQSLQPTLGVRLLLPLLKILKLAFELLRPLHFLLYLYVVVEP